MKTQITDEQIKLLILKYLSDVCVLEEDETVESIINEYLAEDHKTWVTSDKIEGFLCVSEYNNYAIVNFAWHNGSMKAHKLLYGLGKRIYMYYTILKSKPLYYQGIKNHYKNHSKEVAKGIYQFVV